MKRISLLIMSLLLVGCLSDPLDIASGSVSNMRVVGFHSQDTATLRISGLITDSDLVLVEHTLTQEGDALFIKAAIGEREPNDSRATFTFDIDVPPEVNLVTFGRDRSEIWRR